MASVLSGGCRYGEWWFQDVGDQDETGDPAHDQDDDGDWRDSDDDDLDDGVHECDQDDQDDDLRLEMGGVQ